MELFRARRGSPTNTSTDRCSSKIGTNQFALSYGLIREVIATAAGQVERLTLNASETAALPPGISVHNAFYAQPSAITSFLKTRRSSVVYVRSSRATLTNVDLRGASEERVEIGEISRVQSRHRFVRVSKIDSDRRRRRESATRVGDQ